MRRIQYQATIEMAAAFLSFSESSLVQTLMHKLKYENELQVGLYLGSEFGHQLLTSPHFRDIDVVIPVPLHPKKKKSRGYNQCDSVAQGIASILKLPVNTIDFVRLLNNPSQTNMHRMERYDNVENIFRCLNPTAFEGKHVLLVDDVLTTGATIGSAARCLNSAGCRVSVATLAMA
ncbi:phosphoribosyltransferase [Sphingobacterium deserti]|uniref:Phosphoribosyltransferase n=2 Tax=Sphingobacterium deserti TaxID=1229276 RepID=A0A0B8T4C7_9SPHI|nr:phosphoribosyltransferase [Sphingobacterium deserti]